MGHMVSSPCFPWVHFLLLMCVWCLCLGTAWPSGVLQTNLGAATRTAGSLPSSSFMTRVGWAHCHSSLTSRLKPHVQHPRGDNIFVLQHWSLILVPIAGQQSRWRFPLPLYTSMTLGAVIWQRSFIRHRPEVG